MVGETITFIAGLLVTRPEPPGTTARFAFISDKAEFASEDLLDVQAATAISLTRGGRFRCEKRISGHLQPLFQAFSRSPFSGLCARPATAFWTEPGIVFGRFEFLRLRKFNAGQGSTAY